MTPIRIKPHAPVPIANPGQLDVPTLRSELEAQIDGEVRFDTVSRALYSTDASVYQIEPLGVVIPKTREDLARAVRICNQFLCPITVRGGGTSQAGQAIGPGLVLDTSKYLNRVLEISATGRWALLEPGVVLDELNAQLRPLGLQFGPDVSTSNRATLGGMMANNSSGARSVLYGKTIDHVLEQWVVLSDGSLAHFRGLSPEELEQVSAGDTLEAAAYRTVRHLAELRAEEIDRRFPKILRRVGGYNLDEFVDRTKPFNLCKMMVGSEGTLGIVAQAKIRIVPLPKAKALAAIHFHELLEALAATPAILRHRPAAVEVMDRFILDATRSNPSLEALRDFVQGDPGGMLIVELYGDHPEELTARLDALEQDLAAKGMGYYFHRALEPSAQARIWSLRRAALGLSMSMRGDGKSISFVEDTAVAPEKLRDYIERFLGVVHGHGTTAGVYAHASVGCLHVRPVINLKTAEGVKQFEAIASDVADLVLEYGGALSAEHGDGLVRGPFTEKMFGPVLYETFRTVKRTFDPLGILNPGKIVDSPPLTANLRYGAGYHTPDPPSFFDYTEYGGFGRAVEMCSGVGACRKKLEGTMCPSYMATLEETHTTRGRANVLRLAMNGKLGSAELGDQAVRDALELCLECRACKAECPVGVDMARFKSEFLAGYRERHGLPARAYLLGNIHRLSAWGSRLAPLSNLVLRSAPAGWLQEWLLGIDRRRRLPEWRHETFAKWFARRAGSREPAAGGAALFTDTFTNYYEPEVGIAVVEVLERAGVPVEPANHRCCGRPLISQGLLREARQLAQANAELLFPLAERGVPIVFCEPSCLSAVREDAPDLLRGAAREKAQAVAHSSLLFEEYLESACRDGRAKLELAAGPPKVLLHGHCHQKSMGLLAPARALLARIPGAKVVDLDAGCCGMAGSFGYAPEHYEISQRIAERRLLPAARRLEPGEMLVASGTSCRRQVQDLAGHLAQHPAVLLRACLK
ncbi:MAG TPA: FAD-linked oxidase C-terminal domain-containing protein [Bryobacteraceae bacterium]|nr:FAD-linked oxidase C-terminal domain-containing protein [Bryobacteraceae bacterium]